MIRSSFRPRLATLLGLTALGLLVSMSARGDSQPGVERPGAPAKAVPPPVRTDLTKRIRVERPIKVVVEKRSAAVAAPAAFENPKVLPGLVRWHPTWAAACEAAGKSRKPVLLFQMMGKLDDQFC
jgi:hypothetical protein